MNRYGRDQGRDIGSKVVVIDKRSGEERVGTVVEKGSLPGSYNTTMTTYRVRYEDGSYEEVCPEQGLKSVANKELFEKCPSVFK